MAFKINGTSVAEPAHKGLKVTEETIWSSNTGRSSTGKMIGDVVARKATIEVSWPPLSYAQAKTIRDAIVSGGAFFTVSYPDIKDGINSDGSLKMVSKTVYAGNVPRELYSLHKGIRWYSGISVTFIEQ